MATRETNATPTAAASSRLTPRKNSPVVYSGEPRRVLVDDVAEDQRIEQREDLVDGRQHERERHQPPVVREIRGKQLHPSMIPPRLYDRGVADTGPYRHTLLEAALSSDRASVAVVLLVVPAVCWAWIITAARDMYGPMTGASRWMMTPSWDAAHLFLLWTMWAVMMAGMMLPSAAPTVLLYGSAARRRHDPHATGRVYALALGYVATWALFSVLLTAIQRALGALFLLSPMMEATSPRVGGTLLLIAGVYQWTPLKQACLRACQSPLGFLMSRWRAGVRGAFRMGVEHGHYCIACCWALMLLLFAGGVMNLAVIGALTAFVVFEKLGVFGRHGARISGGLLIASGLWVLAR